MVEDTSSYYKTGFASSEETEFEKKYIWGNRVNPGVQIIDPDYVFLAKLDFLVNRLSRIWSEWHKQLSWVTIHWKGLDKCLLKGRLVTTFFGGGTFICSKSTHNYRRVERKERRNEQINEDNTEKEAFVVVIVT
jgi:hypothetical protein